MKKSQIIITTIAIVLVILLIGALGYGYVKKLTVQNQNPIAVIEVKDYGTMKVELYPEKAPNTVKNFIQLANRGFYDELTFHRIIKDFMIQGGDKEGTGKGNATLADLKEGGEDKNYAIKGEFSQNGFYQNDLRHEKGVISMARSDYSQMGLYEEGYNSASSQFFITTKDTSSLNSQYAAFGKVIEGIEVLEKLENVEVKPAEGESSEASTPVNPPVITSIRVDTFGAEYGEPETLEPFDYSSWLQKTYGIDPSTLVSQ